jgi:hypothetical protein
METIAFDLTWKIILLIIWELTWKGLGLYRAGKKQQPIWFVLILIVNSMGILPIIYLLISKDKIKSKKRK